jgi:hypothetical protein
MPKCSGGVSNVTVLFEFDIEEMIMKRFDSNWSTRFLREETILNSARGFERGTMFSLLCDGWINTETGQRKPDYDLRVVFIFYFYFLKKNNVTEAF